MKRILLLIIFVPTLLFSKTISKNEIDRFIKYLVTNNDSIDAFIDKAEIEKANRLGTRYIGADKKYLISYDIDNNKIKKGEFCYTTYIKKFDEIYTRVIFFVPKFNYKKEFIFKNDKWISPLTYYTRDWKQIKSEHFIFFVSDSTLFNTYCVNNLENFLKKSSNLLKFSKKQMALLASKKIYYYLCKDNKEIKKLTGYEARGMFNLAYDAVITTYNAHYHELMHLLINYKIGNVPLYTTPFLQEGFAVAFGGRGGKETGVILNLGLFLYKSDFIHYTSILSKSEFYLYSTSISYPACGLYNYFIINEMGIDDYLKLYLKYSGSSAKVDTIKIDENDLPPLSHWKNFLKNYKPKNMISFEKRPKKANLIFTSNINKIYEYKSKYYFEVSDTLLFGKKDKKFQSKRFNQIFKYRKYEGQEYLIIPTDEEISVYNLYTNNLIASYVASFSDITPLKKDKLYLFSIDKDIFDDDFLREKTTRNQ